jgi:hypothetical protein
VIFGVVNLKLPPFDFELSSHFGRFFFLSGFGCLWSYFLWLFFLVLFWDSSFFLGLIPSWVCARRGRIEPLHIFL